MIRLNSSIKNVKNEVIRKMLFTKVNMNFRQNHVTSYFCLKKKFEEKKLKKTSEKQLNCFCDKFVIIFE